MNTKRILSWGTFIIIIGLIIWGLIAANNKKALPLVGESFPIVSREHIAIGASHTPYNSNPPTSGPHYEQPAEWGVYQTELPDEQLIHNLEHGGIWISYTTIDDATKGALEQIAKSHVKIIVTPRLKDDAPIVLVSWGQLQKLQAYDEQAILKFIKINSNRSPEPFAL